MTSYVKAMYDFSGEPGSSEISIKTEEILTVTRTDVGDGWWEGKKSNGLIGLFPAAYVEVMSAADVAVKLNGSKSTSGKTSPISTNISKTLNSNMRYDAPVDDYNEGDDWEDDWDDENETYSEIGPSNHNVATSFSKQKAQNNKTANFSYILSHSHTYDTKTLPEAPCDGAISLVSNTGSINSNAVKKSRIFTKSSDSYILGYGNKGNLLESEKVYIIQMERFYYWQPNAQIYTVRVASPKKETKFKGMKSFIAYQLTPSFNNISVFRRYKHFDWLHERLVEKFCFIPIPPLPDKQISGRYEEQFVEHRRVQLQEFVDWVCRHPVLSKCEVWYHFLTCTNEKMWKSGKRKAERDYFVGVNFCWAINPPEKQLLHSFVDAQIDFCNQFTQNMDLSIKNLLAIANELTKKNLIQSKKDFQRIGDGISDLAKSLSIDERRAPSTTTPSLSESVGKIGGVFISLGQLFSDQPKLDWIPFADRMHIYRGILSMFPDILSIHKGAIQKKKECERFVAEQKMGNAQLADVNRRTDIISYAVMAEISHFREQRDVHLKQSLKHFIEGQIQFHSTIVSRLKEAYQQFH